MTWPSVVGSIFSYLFRPFTAIFNTVYSIILTVLAPLLYLASYTVHGLLLPLQILGKFETLYIYFGVAAIIGLLTGSILHFSSNIIISILDLHSKPQESGRTAASVRAAREKKLEEAWQTVTPAGGNQGRARLGEALKKEYAEYLDKDGGKKREGQGLLSLTILEEDDSEDGF